MIANGTVNGRQRPVMSGAPLADHLSRCHFLWLQAACSSPGWEKPDFQPLLEVEVGAPLGLSSLDLT